MPIYLHDAIARKRANTHRGDTRQDLPNYIYKFFAIAAGDNNGD